MTAAELIAELQRHPAGLPVMVLMTQLPLSNNAGYITLSLGDSYAQPATVARLADNCVLITGE